MCYIHIDHFVYMLCMIGYLPSHIYSSEIAIKTIANLKFPVLSRIVAATTTVIFCAVSANLYGLCVYVVGSICRTHLVAIDL